MIDWATLGAGSAAIVAAVLLFLLARRRVDFTVRTLLALALGIVLGVVFGDAIFVVEPAGTIYLNALTAIVAPVIVVSLLASVIQLGDSAKLKQIGLKSVLWLTISTLAAIILTLGLAIAFQVGAGAGAALSAEDDPGFGTRPLSLVIIDLFPKNLINDFGGNKIIPIIVVTLAVAVAYVQVQRKNAERAKSFGDLVLSSRAIIYRVVSFVIRLTPYAVLALTAAATARAIGNIEVLWSLLGLLGVTYLACFLHPYLFNAVLLRVWADVSPWQWFRRFFPAQATAFTTQSSIGTLPVTTAVLTGRIGVPSEIAGFAAPLGTTIGMPGCSGVWPVLTAVFAINALGLPFGAVDYIVLVILALLVSYGTAGVPGTATITATTVLVAAGLPLEVLALTLPISAIADMARTLSNVTAAGVTATIVARSQGQLDTDLFAQPVSGEISLDTERDRVETAPTKS